MTDLPEAAFAPLVDRAVADAHAAWAAAVVEGAHGDPYYSERSVRFQPRDDDVLRSVGDVVVGHADCGAAVSSERARTRFDVCGVTERDASAIVLAIDGTRTVAEVRAASGVGEEPFRDFLDRAFGTVVLAPRAVVALENRVSGAEIVRYPGSPYEIVRAYWANMGDVAERLTSAAHELDALPRFIGWLRELNVLALSGSSRTSFYLPASPIAGKRRVEPGALWTAASVVEQATGSEPARFVSGPRVNASLIGGALYHALLSQTLGRAHAPADSAELDWGRVVLARADQDERAAPWFCPPRPMRAAHFDALCSDFARALRAAGDGDRDGAVRALAPFHWRFVRLHPFRAANQCLAMSLVNHVLRRSHAAGIPHLVLDHLALSLPLDAYARVFHIAVAAWLVADENPVERYLELIARKERCFDFLRRLGDASDVDAARQLVATRPEDARLAFVEIR